ncbi:lipopolysaccharide biosynthesis protein [Terrabacter sp. NPDC080008]|uniref:lipopolysaccharide biosynthesis protein n=1 Tax=Terrabacter sp. NPDC080008 TaxID=3155176 RepID=UPI00344E09AA
MRPWAPVTPDDRTTDARAEGGAKGAVERLEPEDEALGRRAASGVLWLAAHKWVVRASGFVTLLVLTHQLSPREFGVVAAAMTVIPMVYLLSDLGFSTYLLQADDVDQESLSTAFWTSVGAAAALTTCLVSLAPLFATAFQNPELAPVLRVLVLAAVPTVLAGVPLALLRRRLAFRSVALQSLAAALLGQVVAVVLALRGGGVWALVCQVIVTQSVMAVLAWRGAAWRPSFVLSRVRLRRMVVFGVWVTGYDVVATVRTVVESWIVSVALGPSALGLLNVAQRLVLVAQELVAASMVPVSTTVFAKVRESSVRLRSAYLRALGLVYAVVSPVMVVIVVTAPTLVPLLFGQQWGASVGPTQALAVAGIITLGAMLDHGLFYGLGRPGTWLAYSVAVDVVTVATTAVAVHWGLTGVTVGFVAVALLATIARWLLISRLHGWTVAESARPFLRIAPVTVLSSLVGAATLAFLPGRPWAASLVAAAVTLVVYVCLLRLMASHVIRTALGVLPVPQRYAARIGRLLGVGRVTATDPL